MPSSSNDVTTSIDRLDIQVIGIDQMRGEARVVFTSATEEYAEQLLGETSRTEVIQRGESSDVVQYTSSQVTKAAGVLNDRGVFLRGRPRWYVFLRVVTPFLIVVFGLALGALVTSQDLLWAWTAIGFFAASFIATFYLENDDKGRSEK